MQPDGQRAFGEVDPTPNGQILEAAVGGLDPSLLDQPLSSLRGVGQHFEAVAREAGVESVRDLLWLVPETYDEPAPLEPISQLVEGQRARLSAEVKSIRGHPGRGGRRGRTEAVLGDGPASLEVIWFNRPWVADQLDVGQSILAVGRLDGSRFVVESHEILPKPPESQEPPVNGPPGLAEAVPRPRHRNFDGIGRGRWRSWAWEANRMAAAEPDPLPASIRRKRGLPDIASALRAIHFPVELGQAGEARHRLAFEELFLYQLFVREAGRRERIALGNAPVLDGGEDVHRAWLAGLPWSLTGHQEAAIEVIGRDLGSGDPMRRLLMGEVGAGKTVVALSAVLRTLASGHQAALMAPTEVLARQHFLKVRQLLEGTGFDAYLLTGSVRGPDRDALLGKLASGSPSLTVGTHALIGEQVAFGSLGIVVVDEEHRFGVRQRSALGVGIDRAKAIHRLHLSATPIPRTLALTVWGDLDLTELRELPEGRGAVDTALLAGTESEQAIEALRREVDLGHQGFVVCPVIRDEGSGGRPSVEGEAARLQAGPLSGYRIGALHGEMPEEAKAEVMTAFAEGRIDVLIATTVVEVGIDVPNATVMVIEGAESFGLAQLHQLRGRVGRGGEASTCFLIQGDDADSPNDRLSALVGTSDGFEIAEADLRLRGEGELTGTRQHGLPRFRVARLPRDEPILLETREELERLLAEGGGFDSPILAPAILTARARYGRGASE